MKDLLRTLSRINKLICVCGRCKKLIISGYPYPSIFGYVHYNCGYSLHHLIRYDPNFKDRGLVWTTIMLMISYHVITIILLTFSTDII